MVMNTLTRRSFLGGSVAFGALSAGRAFAAPSGFFGGGTPLLRIGVLSDIHIDAPQRDFRIFGDTRTFVKALEYFRSRDVDGVVIAGDMADTGMRYQLEIVANAWFSVFPGNRGRDGRTVEKLFVYGNHDMEGCNNWGFNKRHEHKESFFREVIATDPKGAWEDFFREPYAPVWMKTVKGYRFVGAHWVAGHKEGVAAVPPFLAEHAAELKGNRPFFYIQHQHPKDTCHFGHAWGEDDGTATRALSAFPNAVAFSGHSHTPLTDEATVWQGAFTSVGTSSLRFCGGMFRTPTGPNGYENVRGDLMPKYEGVWEARQGQVMNVFDDRIVLERRDFLRGAEPLGDDWVIPLPVVSSAKPFAPENNVRMNTAPEFAPGARLEVAERDGVLVCTYPAATGVPGVRTFDWVITCVQDGGVRFTRYLVDPNCRNAISRAQGPIELRLPKSYFPSGASTLAVAPRGFDGKLGKSIETGVSS